MMTTVSAEDPSVKTPEAPAAPPVTTTASEKKGFTRRLRSKLGNIIGRLWRRLISPGPLKLATILFTALVGFIFGIASNQMADFVKRADNCYDALSMFNDNIYNEGLQIIADIHSPDRQNSESGYTKFRNDIEIPHNKITSKCPVDPRNTLYLDKNDVNAFTKDYYQLLSVCIFVTRECSNDTEADLISKIGDSSRALRDQASGVSQWGLLDRAWFAVVHLW